MHRHTKLRQNWLNGCREIHLTFFKMLPSAILDMLADFGTTHKEYLVVFYHSAKFRWNHFSRNNTKVWIFYTFGLKTSIHALFRGVFAKNREKRKLSAFFIFLQGAPIKQSSGKIHYLSYCNRFFHQIYNFHRGRFAPHMQQISSQYLLWFRNYNHLNLKVVF